MPRWWNGRHARLRSGCLTVCGFESHLRQTSSLNHWDFFVHQKLMKVFHFLYNGIMKQQKQLHHINQKYIWTLIARGWDFTVYHYEKDQVIKYSRLSLLLWAAHRNKMIYDYTICKKYLQDYIVESTVLSWSSQYIELQPYIIWSTFETKYLHHKKIAKQLKDIIKCVHQMQQDWYPPIDLIGAPWLLGKYLANIIVDKDHNLQIIDATLLESKSVWWLWYIFQPIIWLAILIQQKNLKAIMKTLS